jgi:hypothetical protein
MRKATNQIVSERVFWNIRVARAVSCLALIGVVFLCFIIVDYEKEFFNICAMVDVGIVVLLLSWWFLRVQHLKRKQMHHYKCSICGYTWDA